MAEDVVQSFIDALHEIDQTGNLDKMIRLFGQDATIGNAAAARTFEGPGGARDFWRTYRANFREVESEFTRVIANADSAALEWQSRGVAANGEPFRYQGVTLLKLKGDEISGFYSYFNPNELGWQLARHHEAGASPG
ncbi:MAG: nuclear transport factor 2 family protein [Myxococcaceae bacterium]